MLYCLIQGLSSAPGVDTFPQLGRGPAHTGNVTPHPHKTPHFCQPHLVSEHFALLRCRPACRQLGEGGWPLAAVRRGRRQPSVQYLDLAQRWHHLQHNRCELAAISCNATHTGPGRSRTADRKGPPAAQTAFHKTCNSTPHLLVLEHDVGLVLQQRLHQAQQQGDVHAVKRAGHIHRHCGWRGKMPGHVAVKPVLELLHTINQRHHSLERPTLHAACDTPFFEMIQHCMQHGNMHGNSAGPAARIRRTDVGLQGRAGGSSRLGRRAPLAQKRLQPAEGVVVAEHCRGVLRMEAGGRRSTEHRAKTAADRQLCCGQTLQRQGRRRWGIRWRKITVLGSSR